MKIFKLFLIIAVFSALTACGEKTEHISPDPTESFCEILDRDIILDDCEDITGEISAEYTDITSVYLTDDEQYLFLTEPMGYNDLMSLALVIDGNSDTTVGMRIIAHTETEHYVRDMESAWFVDRFADKSVTQDLVSVHLEAESDNEIIIITGATVTTDGVINGVNSAFDAYKEYTNK